MSHWRQARGVAIACEATQALVSAPNDQLRLIPAFHADRQYQNPCAIMMAQGLGLVITRRLARAMGGDVQVAQSKLGQRRDLHALLCRLTPMAEAAPAAAA